MELKFITTFSRRTSNITIIIIIIIEDKGKGRLFWGVCGDESKRFSC